MRGKWYQISLIFLGLVVSALFGVFFLRELFPEYRVYQNTYLELEEFRSTYTGEPPPPFEGGIKQIVLEAEDKGPPRIDRCISCHVTLQFSHFSPTKTARDVNGNVIYDENGIPKKEPNEEYVWKKLDEKIDMLTAEGRESEADRLSSLKTAHVGEHVYDMTKVLQAHPLIGRETRPFEYHPIAEYGCVSCHNGNGRGLVTDRAHGPVYDGQYEEQFMGPEPVFLERDPANDPEFAFVFNHKPGHRLLFQTNPLFVGDLMQAKCVQCHQSNDSILEDSARQTEAAAQRRKEKSRAIQEALKNEKAALKSLLELRGSLLAEGFSETVSRLREASVDYSLPKGARQAANTQLDFLLRAPDGSETDKKAHAVAKIQREILERVGDEQLVQKLEASDSIDSFIENNRESPKAVGSLFVKAAAVEKDQKAMLYVADAETSFERTADNDRLLKAIRGEIDDLTADFQRGKSLYFSQACYACHRIAGLTRGGIGPELTYAGESYPWFLKESIVWPQADLKTSTMPNFRLDHYELEDLVTFLLAQHGRGMAISETDYRQALLEWEAGARLPWEKPINPGKLDDVRYSMTVFASEGCAACHRLKGYESNVGYHVEKESDGQADFPKLYSESQWFQNLFPEESAGSEIVKMIEENQEEIDQRIVEGVRTDGLLEELNEKYPELIESYYSNFRYAARAKDADYRKMADEEKDPEKKAEIHKLLQAWKDRVNRVLMVYVQEYGLGRLIGPRPNWSGIYRSDEWLIEHFRKPSSHIARSIMPVMPFDDSKFYALTYMLDVLAKKNRDDVRKIWDTFGFDPEMAYEIHCSQCHGEYLHGNGPVSEWIYPIPKNLRNAAFLRNYTRDNIINSIVHGVKGTPMPPWGEVAGDKPMNMGGPVLTENEITQLVDWLFSSLLGGTVIRGAEDVPKWQYGPDDVLEELENEGNTLEPGAPPEFLELREVEPDLSLLALPEEDYIASTEPFVAQSGEKNPDLSGAEKIFDIYPNPEGPEPYSYYIKKRYFSEKNIKAGQKFFALNCAVCHGIEADGQGFRAGTMYDAKPRMLTNLHWIDTRDDLRLLRSIKYGIQGTSMTPWGDQTSSLQRLQLVIFIRSLGIEQQEREALFNALYNTFDVADQTLDRARIEEYKQVNAIRERINEISAERTRLLAEGKNAAQSEKVISLYQQELELSGELQKHKEADQLLEQLKDLVSQEERIYRTLGVSIGGKTIGGNVFDSFVKTIKDHPISYQVANGRLKAELDKEASNKIQQIEKQLTQSFEKEIQEKERKRKILEAKLPSQERKENLEEVNSTIAEIKKLRNDFVSDTVEATRLREQQMKVYEEYNKKMKELNT